MKNVLIIILSAYSLLFTANNSFASSTGDIREGNKLYKQEKYSEAADRYRQAVKQSPDSDIAHFNLGDALYKKGQYKEAIDAFTKALSTDNKNLEAKAIYNLANSKFKLGSQSADSDINSAISMYREALDYYKRAIDMKAGDKDAKYNHELVEKKLKVLMDRAKNQQKDQNSNKDNDQDKKDKQDSSKSQDKSGQQNEDKKQQSGQQDKQDTGSGKEAGPKKDKGQSAGKDETKGTRPSGAGKDKEGMTPEEARMLLDAYGQEGTIDDKHESSGPASGVLKDW
ncbi:MAG: tetratricopeptide repeat protein [Nitrospiraceae bacterium]|nr:MAG: tetratricopeptide repeat protein [Nitrospiraceae bacterium]